MSTDPAPRWEFRAWDGLDGACRRLEDTAAAPRPEAVEDVYLLGPSPGVNAKMRSGVLQVKHLLDRSSGFERWEPWWDCEVPVAPEDVGRLLGDLGFDPRQVNPVLPQSAAAMSLVFRRLRDGRCVTASKRRRRFELGSAMAELTEVEFDRHDVSRCVAIEGVDLDPLVELRCELGLDGADNMAMHVAAASTAGDLPGGSVL